MENTAKSMNNTTPARLAHSPSLPNLWPPRSSISFSSPTKNNLDLKNEQEVNDPPTTPKMYANKLNDLPEMKRKRPKTHFLTPSSSLNSDTTRVDPNNSAETVSGESIEDRSFTLTESLGSDDVKHRETAESRFLLVGNVPRHLPTADLKSAFFNFFASRPRSAGNDLAAALADCTLSNNHSVPPPKTSNRQDNPIKGIYVRFLSTSGVIVLAFHDLREAVNAHVVIDVSGSVSAELKQNASEGMWESGLTCRYISPGELSKLIGLSGMVTETEGHFTVTVSVLKDADWDSAPQSHSAISANLEKLLKSFGSLCHFDGHSNSALEEEHTFQAEYHDVRDAKTAMGALNGRTLLGMRLDIFKEDQIHSADGTTPSPLDTGTSAPPTRRNLISFPSSASKAIHTVTPRGEAISRSRCVSVGQGNPLRTESPITPNRMSHAPIAAYEALSSETNSRRSSNTSLFDAVRTRSHQNPSLETSADKSENNGYSATPTSPVSPNSSHRRDQTLGQTQVDGSSTYCFKPADEHAAQLYSTQISNLSTTSYPFVPGQRGVVDPRYQFSATSPPPFGYAYTYPHDTMYTPWWSNDTRLNYPTGTGTTYPGSPPPAEFYYPQSSAALMHQSSHGFVPHVNVHAPAFYPGSTRPERLAYSMQTDDGSMSSNRSHIESGQYYEFTPGSHVHGHFFPASPEVLTSVAPAPSERSSESPQLGRGYAPVYATIAGPQPSSGPERNQLNIPRIEDGLDTRTTVMVKNIPNKMSDKDLISFIHKVCPRRIDFLYLRMDFQNGCNVGYAFVNFIGVEDLLKFATAKLGVKWNMFSSEKVLQMSYANYQGKEALVEKFKNSCIMDEREAWRPKIFISEPGSNQGLPEPFPAPTHLRRKERGAINRGALFIPRPGNLNHQHHHLNNTSGRPPRHQPQIDDHENFQVNFEDSQS